MLLLEFFMPTGTWLVAVFALLQFAGLRRMSKNQP